jgi:two-component system nitrate/nitrite response regulator NarL
LRARIADGGPLLVVDDDELFVEYVRTLLEDVGFRTLTAATGEDALRIARSFAPLVVLLDIRLPGLNGYEVCRALRDEFGQAMGIVFVSGSRTAAEDISSGLLLGADDYVVKNCHPRELVARTRALARRVEAGGAAATPGSRNLTRRELQILRLLADGIDERGIAAKLSISSKTVAIHIEHVLTKLDVHSRAQAVAAAYRERLVAAPSAPVNRVQGGSR